MFVKKLLFGLLVLLWIQSSAQNSVKDTVQINEVEVFGNKPKQGAVGNDYTTIPKIIIQQYAAQSLADLLTDYTNLTVNTYGSGGISNLSICGAGTEQTAVLWNGIPLQSFLNGGFDVSQVSMATIDEVSLQYGGGSALFGSGAIGGVLLLNNNFDFNNGLHIRYNGSFGSFSHYDNSVSLSSGKNKVSLTTKLFSHYILNDYPFINSYDNNNRDILQHAKNNMSGFIQGLCYKLNPKQKITAFLWMQNNYDEVPPQIWSQSSLAVEKTNFARFTTAWERKTDKLQLAVRTAVVYNILNYTNPNLREDDTHRSLSSITDMEGTYFINEQNQIYMGLNETYEWGKSTDFADIKTRNRQAALVWYKWKSKNEQWIANANVRNELVDAKYTPMTYSAGMEYKPTKEISFQGSCSRNYRLPTFDDLYWAVWGNPTLQPEKGWSTNLGFEYRKTITKTNIQASMNGFNNNTVDLIEWIPEGALWHPENIRQVLSPGIESKVSVSQTIGSIHFGIEGLYCFVRSIIINDGTATVYPKSDQFGIEDLYRFVHLKIINDEIAIEYSKLNQLMYVPKNKLSASLFIRYKTYTLRYVEQWQSIRYTSDDNTSWLPGYTLGNISFAGDFHYKQHAITATAKVNNIYNTSYLSMPGYAMPLRSFLLSLSISINNNNLNL